MNGSDSLLCHSLYTLSGLSNRHATDVPALLHANSHNADVVKLYSFGDLRLRNIKVSQDYAGVLTT